MLDHPSEGLLFPSTKRADWPTDPAVLRRRVHERLDDAGLDRLGFHEGRHTFASIAIAAGLNAKTLSLAGGRRHRRLKSQRAHLKDVVADQKEADWLDWFPPIDH